MDYEELKFSSVKMFVLSYVDIALIREVCFLFKLLNKVVCACTGVRRKGQTDRHVPRPYSVLILLSVRRVDVALFVSNFFLVCFIRGIDFT